MSMVSRYFIEPPPARRSSAPSRRLQRLRGRGRRALGARTSSTEGPCWCPGRLHAPGTTARTRAHLGALAAPASPFGSSCGARACGVAGRARPVAGAGPASGRRPGMRGTCLAYRGYVLPWSPPEPPKRRLPRPALRGLLLCAVRPLGLTCGRSSASRQTKSLDHGPPDQGRNGAPLF